MPDDQYLAAWAAGYAAGYDRGHEAGRAEGREEGLWEYDRAMVGALKFTLGGSSSIPWSEAVRRHERQLEQKQRRDECDRVARLPRPNDYTGQEVA